MKNILFLSLFFLTSLAFAGKKYEDQVIDLSLKNKLESLKAQLRN